MIPAYSYTADDAMNPIYCIGCRQHIPLALSNAGAGYCPSCAQTNANLLASQQAAQAQQAASQQAAQQQAAQALHTTATGLGICPQCKSVNVTQFENMVSNTTRTGLTSGGALCMVLGILTFCFGGAFLFGLGAILFIVGICLPSKRMVGTSRACNYCGSRWQV